MPNSEAAFPIGVLTRRQIAKDFNTYIFHGDHLTPDDEILTDERCAEYSLAFGKLCQETAGNTSRWVDAYIDLVVRTAIRWRLDVPDEEDDDEG